MIDGQFFENDAGTVEKELLGKILCRKMPDGKVRKVIITETEAYPASDSACYGYGYEGNHGNKKKTPANAPLFEKGGTCCIYGGMILMVCGVAGKPDNVLIRAGVCKDSYCDGPCKVADALEADKRFHGVSAVDGKSGLWFEEGTKDNYIAVTRKGLGNSVCEEDRERKLRFFIL